MACPVSNLLHFDSTPRMERAAWAAHAQSCARFEEQAAVQAARSAAGLVSISTTCRDLPAVVAFSENCVQIDRDASRIKRLRKALWASSRNLHSQGDKNQQVWMQTLTYKGDNRNWAPEHISRYLDALRKWHYARTGSKTVRYAWVAELQGRGVIHYHVIVWLAAGLTPPKPDTAWRHPKQGMQPPMWPHGMSNRLKSHQPVAYLMKYASKIESKNVGSFPHGARIHGSGGVDFHGRCLRRWLLWPAYVRGNASIYNRFRPAQGGGYVDADTGEFLASEFAPTGGGFNSFIRVRTTPRQVDPSGPFCWLSDQPIATS
ncbi:hypothetical protein PMI14_02387 [Acidovorax sp. CF316]|uniref:rolling circle replication-associated protein n=1 Tax=Acidovorax sp. CF316 TaxID=1144317 RepID=UPI00026BD75C|nr:hypothetical protein [Acidovorax sp. CF316]EJE52908.1 hypothetical protein PMI14_02387 [Acidovorax sp. CF316]